MFSPFFSNNVPDTNHIATLSPTPATEIATSALKPLPVEDIVGKSEFLDESMSYDDLEETTQPEFIKTALKRQVSVYIMYFTYI